MQRSGVVRRSDGDRRDAELAAAAEDADRDLPPVRDEEPRDRHGSTLVVRKIGIR